MRYLSIALLGCAWLAACAPTPEERAAGIAAFETVEIVFQHPRCANCHVPGDAPGAGWTHPMGVVRGPEGHGAPGLPCSTCHAEENSPESYGPNAPPGAPHWGLPPPDQKMAWFGLGRKGLCEMIQDQDQNGDRDLDDLVRHVSEDQLVLWGWKPGGARAAVPVPHAEFVEKFRTWADAGAPCPS